MKSYKVFQLIVPKGERKYRKSFAIPFDDPYPPGAIYPEIIKAENRKAAKSLYVISMK